MEGWTKGIQFLDPSLQIGKRPSFLQKRRRWKDHMSHFSCFRHEKVLNDKQGDLLQGLNPAHGISTDKVKGFQASLFGLLKECLPSILFPFGEDPHIDSALAITFLEQDDNAARFLADMTGDKGKVRCGNGDFFLIHVGPEAGSDQNHCPLCLGKSPRRFLHTLILQSVYTERSP